MVKCADCGILTESCRCGPCWGRYCFEMHRVRPSDANEAAWPGCQAAYDKAKGIKPQTQHQRPSPAKVETPLVVHELRLEADRMTRFLAGLSLQDQPIAIQREARNRIAAMAALLGKKG